jgi:hypothetical protein
MHKPVSYSDAQRLNHLVKLTALLLLAFLAFAGKLSIVSDGIGGSYLDKVSRSYMKTEKQASADLFEVLSASKGALTSFSSGKGGVSSIIDTQVQLGQSLSATYDMVNYAWLFALASLAAMSAFELLLDLSRLSMAPALTLFLCCMGFSLGVRRRLPSVSMMLSEVASFLLFVVLLVHVVIPLSLFGVAAASQHFSQGHKNEIYENVSTIQTRLPQHATEAGLHGQVEGIAKHLQDNQRSVRKSTSMLSILTAKHIVLCIGEYFLAPLILICALSLLSLRIIRRIWCNIGDISAVR